MPIPALQNPVIVTINVLVLILYSIEYILETTMFNRPGANLKSPELGGYGITIMMMYKP